MAKSSGNFAVCFLQFIRAFSFLQSLRSFVTLALLVFCRYGDRVPRGIHSKLFGIVWITCGLVIIALVMSFITTSLTMDIIKSDIPVYGSKVSSGDEIEIQSTSFLTG